MDEFAGPKHFSLSYEDGSFYAMVPHRLSEGPPPNPPLPPVLYVARSAEGYLVPGSRMGPFFDGPSRGLEALKLASERIGAGQSDARVFFARSLEEAEQLLAAADPIAKWKIMTEAAHG